MSLLETCDAGPGAGQGFGTGWVFDEWATLFEENNGDTVFAMLGTTPVWFDKEGGDYIARYGEDLTYQLRHDGLTDSFTVKKVVGTAVTEWELHDFVQTGFPQGAMIKRRDPSGIETVVESYYEGTAKIEELRRSVTADGKTTEYSLLYEYEYGELLASTIRKKNKASEWVPLSRSLYEFYNSESEYGNLGDLELITNQNMVNDEDWVTTGRSYFRYYTEASSDGFAHALRYSLGPEAYTRMVADSLNPRTASNEVLAGYADKYVEYDGVLESPSYRRVTKLVTQNCVGCGGGGSGDTGDTYARSTNPNEPADAYNAWKWKTIRTAADGLQEIIFTNYLGMEMLKAVQHESDLEQQWLTFAKYDEGGRVVLSAAPSAVSGYEEAEDDLLVWDAINEKYQYLRDDAGLIHVTTYYDATDATDTVPGGVAGYVALTKVKEGQLGDEVILTETTYFERVAGSDTVYPVAQQFSYPSESNQSLTIETSYAYTWHTDTVRVKERTTTLPEIPTAQHGEDPPISATRKDYHDELGHLTWQMDERGFITHFVHDAATGLMLRRIDDVDTTVTSGAPAGWETPEAGGFNLITDYSYDELGRQVQTLGPVHTAEVSGVATQVRRASWTVYKESASAPDETWSAQGYATTDDYAALIESDNPAAYWRLGEISGITADNSMGSGLDGTYVPNSGGAWTGGTLGQSGALTGDEDTSVLFNGSTGHITVPHNSAIQPTSSVSVECWFNTSSSSWQRLVEKALTTSPWSGFGLDIGHTADGPGKLYFAVGGSHLCFTNKTYNDGKWHHVVGTYDGTTAKLYVDGVLVKSVTQSANFSTTSDLYIGAFNSAHYFNGRLDEVAIYLHALTADQVAAHYDNGVDGHAFTLINPVSISKTDKAGRVTDSIISKRTTGSGKLRSTNTFTQTDWSRWTHNFYSLAGQLEYTRTYHTIPSSGSGSVGTNYDESFFGYDEHNRLQVRVKTPGGTVTRTVYDPIRRVESVWVGTDDIPTSGGTWEDWSPANNAGANMVQISSNEYDGGNAGGDSNLTQTTQYVDGETEHNRISSFTYDYRNRRLTAFSGTEGVDASFAKSYYDNLGRVVKSERYATDVEPGDGNLLARSETFFDDRGRVYETKTYAVDPSDGSVGNALTGGTWYDEAGNVLKSIAPGAGVVYTRNEYDSLGRNVRTFVAYEDEIDEELVDVIIEETQTTFDEVSNVLYVTSLQRDTDTDPEAPTFRATYTASWYDGADRPIASAAYGTNGGSAFTRPDVTPTRSDTVLVTSTEYDPATGEAFATTDPMARVTKRLFDDAGRTTSVIENFTSAPGTTWLSDAWPWRIKVTIDHTKVPSALTNFPVYLDLAELSTQFFEKVRSDGGDIRVTTSDGVTEVPREVVFIDTTGDLGEFHFKAGSLSSSTDTEFYLYYGNPAASEPAVNASNGRENVWLSDYKAVYHLQQNPAGSAPQMIDSTVNHRNGTSNGSMTSGDSVDGKLAGKALDFDGSNDFINIGDAADTTTAITLSAWVRFASLGSTYQTVLAKRNGSSTGANWALRKGIASSSATDELEFYHYNGNWKVWRSTNADLAASTWYHITVTYDGASDPKIYRNGTLLTGSWQPTVAGPAALLANSYNASVGALNSGSEAASAIIDEARLYVGVLSADWITAEYNNQNSPATFATFGSPEITNLDENRTTLFTYNADGNQTSITAINPATGDQVTTYIYGVTPNDSALASNLLLFAIEYPTDTSESRVEMKYNRLGQVTERVDQAGTIHAYDYDILGRQTQDRVIDTGPDIDEAVLRIATAYEVRGMVETITSYDDQVVGEGAAVNQVLFAYNDFGQLIADYQSHDGVVNTGTTPKVQYTYEDAGSDSNTIRPTSLIYPNGRVIDYSYGTSGGMNDKLNRVESIDEA